jgi:Protein of unknown function (DUF2917)
MACFEHGTIVDLKTRETVTLPDVRGATLRVARGTVWITQEDDTQDIVLRAGDAWTVERNGLTILEAQADVSLCVVGRRIEGLFGRRASKAPSLGAWTHVRDALGAFFASPSRNTVPYF